MSYQFYDARSDPARGKARALAGMPGTASYPQRVAAFNTALYQPQDTQRRTPGDAVRIAPGSYVTPYGTASVRFQDPRRTAAGMAGMYGAINPPSLGGLPGAQTGQMTPGAFVPTAPAVAGMPAATQSVRASAFDAPAPSQTGPMQGPMPNGQTEDSPLLSANATMGPLGSGTGVGNAMQRWTNPDRTPQQQYNGTASGMRSLSPQTLFFRTTRRIDAHAYPATPADNEGAIPGAFDPGGAHMPSRPVTPPAGGYSWQPKNQQLAPAGSWSTYTPY